MTKFVKRVFRRAKKAVVKAVKKRYYHKGKLSSTKVLRDVAMIKNLMNVEKKRYYQITSGQTIAQLNANVRGASAFDCTPMPVSGSGYTQRNGSSIKLLSQFFDFQFYSQSAFASPMQLRIEIWRIRGVSTTANTLMSELYNQNNVVGGYSIIDYNSLADPDYLGAARKVITKRLRINSPKFAGESCQRSFKFGVRYKNHHCRFDDDTQTLTDGQLLCFIFADNGNCSTTTASLATNVPVTAINTGVNWNLSTVNYYVDN